MKYVYLILLFIFSVNSFGQNEILGEWSLQSMIIDGVEDFNIPDDASIKFTTNSELGGDLLLEGRAACNEFGGTYIITASNTVDIVQFSPTLVVCNTTEETSFENSYFNDILYSEGDITSLQYLKTGYGLSTTLTLTNVITNNIAIYKPTFESELLGEWFLNSINYDGTQLDNYLNNHPYVLKLDFTVVTEDEDEFLISFNGNSTCSAFIGTYMINGSSLSNYGGFAILPGECFGTPQQRYEDKYLEIISNQGGNPTGSFEYGITGNGTDEILTITNSNGNFAVYGRTPIFDTIFKTWYLTTIDDNGTIISIPATDSPSLRLTTSSDAVSRILFDGNGECNNFSGFYSIYGTDDNALTIFEFNAGSVTCDIAYEPLYFDIFSDLSTNYLTYELVNDGQTLILTDLSGRTLFFGDQPINQEILGEWNLHYIEVDGNQQYSTIPNSINNILFNDDDTFSGGVCNNGYGGNYTVNDSNTLEIPSISALAGGCNYPSEIQLFLDPYFWTVLSGMDVSSTFSYVISGSGDDETLQITNSNNDSAFYGRSPLPETDLPGTWYLNSITKNDVTEVNVYEPNFNINFTLNPGLFTGLDYDGFAVCKNYFGPYRLEGTDTIRLSGISFTLNICQQYGGSFEDSYFSFFAEAQVGSMDLNYDIVGIGDDETLVLTSENGDYLTYGRQPVSVIDNNLISRWYLQYINVDGEQLDNFYNSSSYSLDLDLTNIVYESSENTLRYDGLSSCNGFGGGFSYSDSTITFQDMAVTLADCQGTPSGTYENYYLDHILRNDNNLPSTLNYTLSDSGINQPLTLEASNGDFAVYGRIAPMSLLFTTWYLSSIESNGIITEISNTESPTINLTANRSNPVLPGLTFNGQGDCNTFDGDYTMYFNNTNSIKINNFSSESTTCTSDYETEYFALLSNSDTNLFSFEVLNADSTLRLTDINDNKLVYSSQPLSISENEASNLSIRLKENPVKSELLLIVNASLGNQLSYQIFSVDGKKILNQKLNENHSINVETLDSGIYFLTVYVEDNLKQTLKFIKQ